MLPVPGSPTPPPPAPPHPPPPQELPLLEASDAPELSPTYWPTLRSLVAHGLPELALRLLRRHGPSAPDAEPMLLRLEALLEQASCCCWC